MKRSSRIRVQDSIEKRNKYIVYTLGTLCVFVAIILSIVIYSNQINQNVQESTMSLEEMAKVIEENNQIDTSIINEETESASTSIGESIEEAELDQGEEEIIIEEEIVEEIVEENTSAESVLEETEEVEETEVKELNFIMPVDGEIIREFAKEILIYSETLGEWTTHLAIDIAAEKTSVVKSAEAGTIKSIKNDPRYGLTVVIEHSNGYETVYSNLLTSEFVVEGEEVEQNQSIGTVGNTAAFESLDEPHLHFELWENGVQVDPMLYITID